MQSSIAVLLGLVAVAAARTGYGYGGYGYAGPYGYGYNNEYNYRQYGGYPVHVGGGNFQYHGSYSGSCGSFTGHGFYYAGEDAAFIVCDNGRAHRFECPKGTKNKNSSEYSTTKPYTMAELCSVHTSN